MKNLIRLLKVFKFFLRGTPCILSEIYPEYEIGRCSYGNPKIFSEKNTSYLKIGSFCSFASGVKIFLGGEHRTDWVTTYPFNVLWQGAKDITGHPKTKGNVIIGNDVWIGTDAIIISGVQIGHGAVVGAGAVVSRDVAPYTIVAGNPARVVKKRFDDSIIQQLLEIAWWDFDSKDIETLLPIMLCTDIQAFIQKAQQFKLKNDRGEQARMKRRGQ